MSFTGPFSFGPVFFQTALPYSGGYYLERGWMSLPDAVGINCKKGATAAQLSYYNSLVMIDLISLPPKRVIKKVSVQNGSTAKKG